ncbi:MAG: hypothetical protein ACJ765_04480 [Chloroflexota bacterium]
MSASARTAPAQMGFGRLPSAFAALALVVILAATVAIVALNGTKAATPVSPAKAIAPPAVIDHGWSNGETRIGTTWAPSLIPSYGGFAGPRLGTTGMSDASKDDTYVPARAGTTGSTVRMRAQ